MHEHGPSRPPQRSAEDGAKIVMMYLINREGAERDRGSFLQRLQSGLRRARSQSRAFGHPTSLICESGLVHIEGTFKTLCFHL